MVSRLIHISGVLFAALLAGCATQVGNTVKATEAQIAKYSNLSPEDIVAALAKSVNEAKDANMPFLAPHYFLEASEVLSECQSTLGKKPKTKDELAADAAKGEALLEKGRAVMAAVQSRFAKELELKSRLDTLSTAKLFRKDYEEVVGDLSKLIEMVERERTDGIEKDAGALLKAMLNLEIRTIQEITLHESEIINANSKEKNADKQAPATFAEALRVFQEAKNQIAAAPRDEELVRRVGAQALFAARHAQQVNERIAYLEKEFKLTAKRGAISAAAARSAAETQSKEQTKEKTKAIEEGPVETIVLLEEDRLLGISIALGNKDLRDLPLEKQVGEIKRIAEEVAHQATSVNAQDFEARLKTADEATREAMSQLAAKDQLLAEKDQQLEAQVTQLAGKDSQIQTLNDRISELEGAKKRVVAKP